jgi:hypothetical protein
MGILRIFVTPCDSFRRARGAMTAPSFAAIGSRAADRFTVLHLHCTPSIFESQSFYCHGQNPSKNV